MIKRKLDFQLLLYLHVIFSSDGAVSCCRAAWSRRMASEQHSRPASQRSNKSEPLTQTLSDATFVLLLQIPFQQTRSVTASGPWFSSLLVSSSWKCTLFSLPFQSPVSHTHTHLSLTAWPHSGANGGGGMQRIYSLALRRAEGFSCVAAARWVAQGNIWRGQRATSRLSINSPFGRFYSRVQSPGDVTDDCTREHTQSEHSDENASNLVHVLPKHGTMTWWLLVPGCCSVSVPWLT